MARPRKHDIEKRIHQVNIRLTEQENIKVTNYAASSGTSPANWIRAKIFTGKPPAARLSIIDQAVYNELRKIGVNLNQATHKLNQGEMPKDFLLRQLELINMIKKILKLLTDDRQPDQG